MEENNLQVQINEISKKLDLVIEEIELQKRLRKEKDMMKEDLMRVAKNIYEAGIEELEDVHDHIKTGDMWFLFKKLLRNVNNITKTFEQLENLKDFFQDFAPVARDMFQDTLNKLNEFDKKGYFEFARELSKVSDKIVTSFSVDDVKKLGDNTVTILNTVKNLTQPDMLMAVNNAVNIYKNLNVEITEKITLFSLMKELNTPEAKRGLAFAIKFLKNISTINK